MSNPDRKGFVLKTRFVIALVAYTISDESVDVFSFSNKWLFSETFAIILCSRYDLHGKTSITNDELLYTLSERNNKILMEFGISGTINEPYAINSCKVEGLSDGAGEILSLVNSEGVTSQIYA